MFIECIQVMAFSGMSWAGTVMMHISQTAVQECESGSGSSQGGCWRRVRAVWSGGGEAVCAGGGWYGFCLLPTFQNQDWKMNRQRKINCMTFTQGESERGRKRGKETGRVSRGVMEGRWGTRGKVKWLWHKKSDILSLFMRCAYGCVVCVCVRV